MDFSVGNLQIITGPMFSGKTTEILKRKKIYEITKKKVMVIKKSFDYRYEKKNEIQTHNGISVDAISVDFLSDLNNSIEDVDVIMIDEGQFFTDLYEFVVLALKINKIIIISILNGDFRMKPFKNIENLFALADSIDFYKAVCQYCYKKASFSRKKDSLDNKIIDVGGLEKYEPVCRYCYEKMK